MCDFDRKFKDHHAIVYNPLFWEMVLPIRLLRCGMLYQYSHILIKDRHLIYHPPEHNTAFSPPSNVFNEYPEGS